jgi:uncharacterized protein YcbK (DUF882 family)
MISTTLEKMRDVARHVSLSWLAVSGLILGLAGGALAGGEHVPTAAFPESYSRSSNPGYLRIASAVMRSNCSKSALESAALCTYEGKPLGNGGEIPATDLDQIKKVFLFPVVKKQRDEMELPKLLVEVLVHISDTMGGSQICLLSGFRCFEQGGTLCNSFQNENSKHLTGHAADITIPGVDNVHLATYALYLNDTDPRFKNRLGVGYYPNEEHVHIDVRDAEKYWVDYSSGDEPPKYDNTHPHPKAAFFKHYDERIAPRRPGGRCPTMNELRAEGDGEDTSTSSKVRWRNVLMTEPPLGGSPLSRQRFLDTPIDFSPVRALDGLDQL